MPEPDPLPAIKTPWGAATPPSGAGAGDVPPIPIPDHTLIRRIGKGSYGEVWLARNAIGVYRAVKIIHRRTFDDDRPFEREFAGMQRFEPVSRSHESQLNILHVGRGPDCFYYVMELADDMGRGAAIDEASYSPRNLRSELLLKGRLPVDECLRLGLALTTALGHLHRHGLVHRDIKPSNIVFVNGIPKLADIGLVALAESTMSFVGTEGYLPPEGPGTVQADLFSLGKVLYEISTGRDRQQFPELPTGITELPDRAALAEFNEVILRACAPDAKQRYESAAEMHADLALLQSGKSVARMRAVERRLKFVARAGAAVTVIALLAGAAFLYQQVQTREARRLANENARLGEENRQRIVRLAVANGVRLMDGGDLSGSRIKFTEAGGSRGGGYFAGTDLSGSLLWFADALPRVAHSPAEAEIHRIRIQSVLSTMPRLVQVVAHDASVQAGTFSPDGRRVATGSRDGELRVWDAQTTQPAFPPLHFGNPIRSLRFSRDGRRLVVRSTSDTGLAIAKETNASALVLDAATGKPLFERITNAVKTAYSANDRWLAAAQTDFTVQLFDASTGRRVVELAGHTNEITALVFSADGAWLLTGSRDRTARIWRIPTGEPEDPPLRHEAAVVRAAISPDGRRAATVTEHIADELTSRIHIWDSKSGNLIGTPLKVQEDVTALFLDGVGAHRLFTCGVQLGLQVWDVATQTEALPALRTRSSGTRGWAFSRDGARLAVGSEDFDAYVWSLKTGELLLPPLKHNGWVEAVEFSPDGNRLLTTSDDGTARVWDLMTLADKEQSLKLAAPILGAALSQDGNQLLAGLRDGTIRRINLTTWHEEPPRLPGLDGQPPQGLAFDAAGRQWAAALGPYEGNGNSHSVGLWRQEGEHVRHLELPHARAVMVVGFNPAASQLVTVADDVSIRVWNTADGTLAREVSLADRAPTSATISPDARTAAVALGRPGGRSRDLQVVSLDTSQPIGAVIHEEEGIAVVAFSPDSRRLAIAGSQWGRIWDAVTGEPLTPQFKAGGRLTSVGWSPDGRRVITAGLADLGKIWDATTGTPLLSPMWSADFRQGNFSGDGRFVEEWGWGPDRHVRLWDASTAEVLTPRWLQDGDLWIVRVTAAGRLVVASGDTIRSRKLQPKALPTDVVVDYAMLCAGRRLNAAGVMLPLKPDELVALLQSLRARAPLLFATP